VLACQVAVTVPWILHRSVYGDEALYFWSGHLELSHWLHGTKIPAFPISFSGAPIAYPPLSALAGSLAASRALSCCFMLASTILLWLTTRRLFRSTWAATAAAGLFVTLYPTMHLGSFATFDALSLLLLVAAAYLGVLVAEEEAEWIVICAAMLLAANVTKYASILWDPVVFALVALHSPSGRPSRATFRRAILVFLCWLGGLAIVVELAGSYYLRGLANTTLHRATGTTSPGVVLQSALQWEGILVALAIAGTLAAAFRRDGASRVLVCVVMTLAALFAPLEQTHIHTLTSLNKHVAFGAWFAAAPAGYGVALALGAITSRARHPGFATACLAALLAVPLLALGLKQQSNPAGESHSAFLVSRLKQLVTANHGKGLILVDSAEVAHAYPTFAGPWNWRFARGVSAFGHGASGVQANLAMIKQHQFVLVALRLRGLTKSQDHLYRRALSSTRAYKLIGKVPFSGGVNGQYLIWQLHRTGVRQ
jgi:hypothetical protein